MGRGSHTERLCESGKEKRVDLNFFCYKEVLRSKERNGGQGLALSHPPKKVAGETIFLK